MTNFDLFGDPIDDTPPKLGRPLHERTEEISLLIRSLAAQGKSQQAIASIVGISGPTLMRHYFPELGASPLTARRRAERASKAEISS